jgi:hypothetical protein
MLASSKLIVSFIQLNELIYCYTNNLMRHCVQKNELLTEQNEK